MAAVLVFVNAIYIGTIVVNARYSNWALVLLLLFQGLVWLWCILLLTLEPKLSFLPPLLLMTKCVCVCSVCACACRYVCIWATEWFSMLILQQVVFIQKTASVVTLWPLLPVYCMYINNVVTSVARREAAAFTPSQWSTDSDYNSRLSHLGGHVSEVHRGQWIAPPMLRTVALSIEEASK